MKRRIFAVLLVLSAELHAVEDIRGAIFGTFIAYAATGYPWGIYFSAYDNNNKPVQGNAGNVYYPVRVSIDDPTFTSGAQTGGSVPDIVANDAQVPNQAVQATACPGYPLSICTGGHFQPVQLGPLTAGVCVAPSCVDPRDGAHHLLYFKALSQAAGADYILQNSPVGFQWDTVNGTFLFEFPAPARSSRISAAQTGVVVNTQDTYYSVGTTGTPVCSCPTTGQCGSAAAALGVNVYDGAVGGYFISKYGISCANVVACSLSPNSSNMTAATFATCQSTINANMPSSVQQIALAWSQPSYVTNAGTPSGIRAIAPLVAYGSVMSDDTAHQGKCTSSSGVLVQGPQNPMFNTASSTPFTTYSFRPTMMLAAGLCNGSCNSNQTFLPTSATVTAVTDNLDGTETLTLSAAQSGMASGFIRVNGQSGGCAQFNGRQPITLIDSTHIKLNGPGFSGACAWTNSTGSLTQWYEDVGTMKGVIDAAVAAVDSNPTGGNIYYIYGSRTLYPSTYSSSMLNPYSFNGHSATPSTVGTFGSLASSTLTGSNILFFGNGFASWTYGTLTFLPGAALASDITSTSGVTNQDGNQTNPMSWLAKGAVAALGTVTEPCSLTQSKYVDAYLYSACVLQGGTVGECIYSGARNPWVMNPVGNPLAAPFSLPATTTTTHVVSGKLQVSGKAVVK